MDLARILAPPQHVASGATSPRAFVPLEAERQLLLANDGNGMVVTFSLQEDGTSSQPGAKIVVPGAAFPFVMAGCP